MNPGKSLRGFPLLLTTVVALTSCGGDSSNGDIAGIGGTGITTSGTITGFGSIFVNGIEFETKSSSVSVDDSPGSESDLALGMVVTVSGTVNADGVTGTANTVIFDDDVQGPISNIVADPDGLTKTLTVLGVTVRAGKIETIFDGVSFDTLAVDDVVEVSGFQDGNGSLRATRIEKKESFVPGSSEIEIKGNVTGLSGSSFNLGSFSVEYGGADLSEVPGGTLTNGMQVEVKGTLSGTTITATRIEQEDSSFGSDVSKVSLEGIVTNFASNSSFSVAGQEVNASGATLQPASLVLVDGVEVEVEGPIVDSVLQAIKVEARGGDVKLDARVLSVDNAAGSITLQFVPGNLTVIVNSQTLMRDDLGASNPFTLGSITAGNFLEVRGFIDGNGNIVASEIKRDKTDDDIVQGPADSCTAGSSLSVLGLSYTLADGTTSYQDQNDISLGNSTTFCNVVSTTSLFVKIKDDEKSRDGVADEVELED